ncbi:hypothetical protein [Clostridium sulfidigenes]|uniref:hypothetical protein n=1 Tax=Clostridium sulfidigenes TaxID=318464 RepID=UPI003F8A384A
MILDKLLMNNLGNVGDVLLAKSSLTEAPKNIDEMRRFLETVKTSIENDEFEGTILGNIFYSFVSAKEVRDRSVTSRTFEDIFSGLFHENSTDTLQRTNPISTAEIIVLDALCEDEDWTISGDLSGNKREKSDLNIGSYSISLKTLKGQAFNENDELLTKEDKDFNDELNVGSLSYRALLKGLLEESHLKQLSDRKKGLGSKKQIIENVINPMIEYDSLDDFKSRLALFLNYVYDDDIYIVLKSDHRIIFHLIPRESFIQSLTKSLENDVNDFVKIFYRWENNNLRIKWIKMIEAMTKYDLPYYSISIFLQNSLCNEDFKNFRQELGKQIGDYINKYLEK